MGNQLPVIKPEEQEVWAKILYRECREAGVTIELNDLQEFCKRIWKVSPWLEQTGISRERWGAVGEQMTAYEQQCPGELEDLDFLIFGVIKSLLEGPERLGRDWNESGSRERGGENPGKQKVKECREKIGSELHLADGKGEAGEHTPCLPSAPPYSTLYWSDSPAPQSSLEKGIRKAIENGEDRGTFPVVEIADPSVPGGVWRSHIPIEWKRVGTLKEACTKHGPNSPFVIAMLETLSGQFILTPNDWKSLARACLTPGQNVIWVSEFSQKVKSTTSGLGAQAPQAYQQFTGTGQFEATGNQLHYSAADYVLIAGMAIAAWKVITSKKEREFPMTRITQGNTEPFTNFVARLHEAVGQDMGEENQGTEIVLKTLLRQNCNHDCKKAMLGLPKNASVEEMIQRCERVGSPGVFGTGPREVPGRSLK
ncbi:igE-binding protein-like [Notamacropus eugenii]|uniref:igE-binding protein-like n=1 Tax=Notamacropus eugenii TaxID=9315 RepID=UPI003B67C92E